MKACEFAAHEVLCCVIDGRLYHAHAAHPLWSGDREVTDAPEDADVRLAWEEDCSRDDGYYVLQEGALVPIAELEEVSPKVAELVLGAPDITEVWEAALITGLIIVREEECPECEGKGYHGEKTSYWQTCVRCRTGKVETVEIHRKGGDGE